MAEEQSTSVPDVEYRDCPGHPGYRVGSDGTVLTCWGRGRAGMVAAWRLRKLRTDPQGYQLLELKGNKTRPVHQLVLEAFVGPRPDGMQGCHNDGNPLNNRIENLRWDTPKANGEDKVEHGRSLKGRKNRKAKLTEQQVLAIRSSSASQSVAELAGEFGVSEWTIRQVKRGRLWRHLPIRADQINAARR